MMATLLVRYREEIIATVTTNIRQYYTTDPQTDGILVLVQDEGDITREIYRGENSNGYYKHQTILHHKSTNRWYISISTG
jgi:hypothetical protein